VPSHNAPHRRVWTTLLLALESIAAFLHAAPSLVFPPRPATTAGVVALTQQFGPVWFVGFVVTALWLAVGLQFQRGLSWAHVACMTVWVSYSAALATGAIIAHGTWFFPAVTIFVASMHAACAWFYNEAEGRRNRRERR
jgi:hypothetical protein